MQRRVRVFAKCPFVLYHLCILRDAIAVAVVSLIPVVRESKQDANLFIEKRYIQLVNFITELVPQKVNKKK